MTTEEDFQRQLDENPDDFHTRLVFADWLEEHSDIRAAGYRALGRRQKRPMPNCLPNVTWGREFNASYGPEFHCYMLPKQWFRQLESHRKPAPWWSYFDTRREADDAAAFAFLRLPEKLRTELLKP